MCSFRSHSALTNLFVRSFLLLRQADPSLRQGLETANTHLTKILSYVASGSPPLETHVNATTGDNEDAKEGTLAPTAVASPSHLHTSLQTRSITLRDDRVLTFTEDDVPAPPAVSFADDLPMLNRMWDDTSVFWDNHSYLVIKGFPIALIHWKDIYTSKSRRSWKPNQWKGMKERWFDWKVSTSVIMLYDQQPTLVFFF